MSTNNQTAEGFVEISLEEYNSIKSMAAAIATQNQLVLGGQTELSQGQVLISDIMKSLLEQLGKQETLVIPAPNVQVEAAKVMIPEMLAPVVQMMEHDEPRPTGFTITRDGRGMITGGTFVYD